MSKVIPVDLRSFKQGSLHRKTAFKKFLAKLEKDPPPGLDLKTLEVEKEVWKEVECLTCGNCCKAMTPTYTLKDIKRISIHLEMTAGQFKNKWLQKERATGDWVNKSTPCPFLDLSNNKCSIYTVRPVDCSGFPHLSKRRMVEYMHVHKQNLEFCPASFKMVEKMMMKVWEKKNKTLSYPANS